MYCWPSSNANSSSTNAPSAKCSKFSVSHFSRKPLFCRLWQPQFRQIQIHLLLSNYICSTYRRTVLSAIRKIAAVTTAETGIKTAFDIRQSDRHCHQQADDLFPTKGASCRSFAFWLRGRKLAEGQGLGSKRRKTEGRNADFSLKMEVVSDNSNDFSRRESDNLRFGKFEI